MAKTALVERDIADGEKLVRSLDESNVPVSAALWYFAPESEIWRLVVASPFVDSGGPRKAYKRVRDALHSLPESSITLDDVSVTGAKDPLVRHLRAAFKIGSGVSRVRVSKMTANGFPIEDAYIYRLA